MNVIKTNKRSLLSNESLNDLLLLAIDSPPLKDFCPDDAIDLWWKEKVCRPHQNPRKKYRKYPGTTPSTAESRSSEEDSKDDNQTATDMLAEWDTWMPSHSDS